MLSWMQVAGTTSWKMSTDEPQSLLTALYVRDACGLSPRMDPELPPLEPVIAPEIQCSAQSNASAQWAEWWRQLLGGGGFWPDHRNPAELSGLTDDPDIQRLFYWPSRHVPPDFAELSDMPELQALMRKLHDSARAWSEARKHEFVALSSARQRVSLEWDVVKTVERGLGRSARPFELDIRVLPVGTVQGWRLSATRALVTRALFRDRSAYREWLRLIVEELA
jgi:hypothetical protein